MEQDVSLPFSQDVTTGPYPEPAGSCLYVTPYFFKI